MRKFLLLLLLPLIATADVTMPIVVTTSPINLSMICTRSTGVSPLGVVCSAVGTTSAAVTSKPFHEIEYRWNFGDPNVTAAGSCGVAVVSGEGFWRCGSNAGSNSKNTQRSPIAGHTFEITEGGGNKTFTVTLTAYDGTNTATQTQTITVTDPAVTYAGALTLCFKNAAGSSDVNCPTGGTVTGSTSAFSLASCTAGKRCLFKRGDSFAAAATQTLSAVGPVTIGAYGTGAQPIVTSVNIAGVVTVGSGQTDLRVMDLNVLGSGSTDTGTLVSWSGGVSNYITVLRMSSTGDGTTTNIRNALIVQSGSSCFGCVLQDNYLINMGAAAAQVGYGVFGNFRLSAIVGNSIGPFTTNAAHNIRIQPAREVTVANNFLSTPGSGGLANFSLRAQEHFPDGIDPTFYAAPDTQYVDISDNKMDGGTTSSEMFQIQPASTTQNQWIYDVIAERNWIIFGPSTQHGLFGQSVRLTVRNNLCDASLSTVGRVCFSTDDNNPAGAPHPDDNQYLSNTCYASGANTGSFFCVILGLTGNTGQIVTNTVVRDNLAYAPPSASAPRLLFLQPPTGGITGTIPTCTTACASNSSDAQATGTSPNFTSVSPFNPANAKPTSGYAIAGGVSVPVWSDFFLVTEPSPRDIGAVIH